jgi:hypothetical protein
MLDLWKKKRIELLEVDMKNLGKNLTVSSATVQGMIVPDLFGRFSGYLSLGSEDSVCCTGWGPRSLDSAQLRFIVVAELTMVYGKCNELVHGLYKPTYNYNWGP